MRFNDTYIGVTAIEKRTRCDYQNNCFVVQSNSGVNHPLCGIRDGRVSGIQCGTDTVDDGDANQDGDADHMLGILKSTNFIPIS